MKELAFIAMLTVVLLSTAIGWAGGRKRPTWGVSRPSDNARRGAIRGALTGLTALLIVLALWWLAGAITP